MAYPMADDAFEHLFKVVLWNDDERHLCLIGYVYREILLGNLCKRTAQNKMKCNYANVRQCTAARRMTGIRTLITKPYISRKFTKYHAVTSNAALTIKW